MKGIQIALFYVALAFPPGRVNATTYRLDDLQKLHLAEGNVPKSVNFTIKKTAPSGMVKTEVYGTATGLFLKDLLFEHIETTLQMSLNVSVMPNPPEIPEWLEKEYLMVEKVFQKFLTAGKEYYSLLNPNWVADTEARWPQLKRVVKEVGTLIEQPTFQNFRATLLAARALVKAINRKGKRLYLDMDVDYNPIYKFQIFGSLEHFKLALDELDSAMDDFFSPNYLARMKLDKISDLTTKLMNALMKRYSSIKPTGACSTITQEIDKMHTIILNLDYNDLRSRRDHLISLSARLNRGLQLVVEALSHDSEAVIAYLDYATASLLMATCDHLKTLTRTLLQPLQDLKEIMLVLKHAEMESGNPVNVERFDPIFLEESIDMLKSNKPIDLRIAVKVMGTAFTEAAYRLFEAFTLHLRRLQERLTKNSTNLKDSNVEIADTIPSSFTELKDGDSKIEETVPEIQTVPCNCGVSQPLLRPNMVLPIFVLLEKEDGENMPTDGPDPLRSQNIKEAIPKIWEMVKGFQPDSILEEFETLGAQVMEVSAVYLKEVYDTGLVRVIVVLGKTNWRETGGDQHEVPRVKSESAPAGLPETPLSISRMSVKDKATGKNTLGAAKNALPMQRKPSRSKMVGKSCTKETCEPDASLQELVVEREELAVLGQV
ncbi:uncharacterized protein [Procambarus clarkii]|uniref:uncharacterized protein n=1 Tax=Procambarus clarkii TaxID=6728 RepID=UPI001E671791|nr:uncharacterized protein LOC123745041 [Procambarus clarkii]